MKRRAIANTHNLSTNLDVKSLKLQNSNLTDIPLLPRAIISFILSLSIKKKFWWDVRLRSSVFCQRTFHCTAHSNMPSSMTIILFYIIICALSSMVSNSFSFTNIMPSSHGDTLTRTRRELQTGDSPAYPEEITCMDQSYNGFLDLSYTYAMETVSGVNIYDVIGNIEGEIMIKLSETVLTCGGNVDGVDDSELPFDRKELGIVGVNSLPPDSPSQLCKFTQHVLRVKESILKNQTSFTNVCLCYPIHY